MLPCPGEDEAVKKCDMAKEMFMAYEAPCVEVLSVEVEKGFAGSLSGSGEGQYTPITPPGGDDL